MTKNQYEYLKAYWKAHPEHKEKYQIRAYTTPGYEARSTSKLESWMKRNGEIALHNGGWCECYLVLTPKGVEAFNAFEEVKNSEEAENGKICESLQKEEPKKVGPKPKKVCDGVKALSIIDDRFKKIHEDLLEGADRFYCQDYNANGYAIHAAIALIRLQRDVIADQIEKIAALEAELKTNN